MIPLVNDNYRYILFYNPKSACSTFRKLYVLLHRQELDNDENLTHHNCRLYWPMRDDVDYEPYFKFEIVRNPYSRVVSAYIDKCCEIKFGQERFKRNNFLKSIHYPIFKFLGREPDFERGYTFKEFLNYIMENEESNIDVHFRGQFDEAYQLNAIYRIEDDIDKFYKIMDVALDGDKEKMTQIRGFFEGDNNSKNSNRTFSADFKEFNPSKKMSEMSFKDINLLYDLKYKLDYDNFYDLESKEMVAKIYGQDLLNFNYDYPYDLK